MNADLAKNIEGGAKLKKADVVDKSGPKIESDVHVKKVDRNEHLTAISGDHGLKHVETVDKAQPKIEEDVHVKKDEVRPNLLAEIEKAKK